MKPWLPVVLTVVRVGVAAAPQRPLSDLQEEFLRWRYGMFLHFGMATFTEREWANGHEDPAAFVPSRLDCGQWADVAREAGMRYAVLTVKHTGGWCLWDSAHTTHDIAAFSQCPGQPRDIVREFVDAFRARGHKIGLYYCFPGDYDNRNGNTLPSGATSLHGLPPEAAGDYTGFIKKQLTELLTGYGPIDLLWIDQYRNKYTRTDWLEIKAFVHSLQPRCLVLANNSTDVRDTDLHSYEYPWRKTARPGTELPPPDNPHPAEVCDTLTGAEWFWKTTHDAASIKTAKEIADMVALCNARRANYLLNVPPDRSGRIPDAFAERLREAARKIGDLGPPASGAPAPTEKDLDARSDAERRAARPAAPSPRPRG